MKINVWIEKSALIEKCSYVLDFISRHPLTGKNISFEFVNNKEDAALIYAAKNYGYSMPTSLFVPMANCIFNDLIPPEQIYLNAYFFEENILYAVEDNEKQKDYLLTSDSFHFDWFETIFFHLSRYEEVIYPVEKRNEWDMMPEDEQILVKYKLNYIPVLDHLVLALLKVMNLECFEFKSNFLLSHDIDQLESNTTFFQGLKQLSAFVFYRRSFWNIFKLINKVFFDYKHRYQDYSFLNKSSFNAQKWIYLHVGGNHAFDPKASKTRNKELHKLCKLAIANNYKIGLHPSYEAAINGELFALEKSKLEAICGLKINSSRQHYLHFDAIKTVAILSENHIQEDSSMAYNLHIGFRAGTGCSFYLYDWTAGKASNVMERPLVWMDSAQRYEVKKDSTKYMDSAYDFFESISTNTEICLNIHNTTWVDYPLFGIDLHSIPDKVAQI